MEERGTFARVGDVLLPEVHPRLSRTPGRVRHAGEPLGASTDAVLAGLGVDDQELASLREEGVI